MDISFVIVNRDTRELLLDCISSIYLSVSPASFEIFVVDNGSSDRSLEGVRQVFPEVRCIENDRNLGFARANNQAIRQASGKHLVLLNTDAVLTPSAITTISSFMDSNQDVAICGGQLLNSDGSLQNSIANYPTLATELLSKSLLRRMFPKRYPGKEVRFEHPVEVETIIGACMVVSKKAIDQVGMLDEDFFFFFEETDWCHAMEKSGWRVMFHPESRIYHLQGQTAKKVNIAARVEYWRSRYIYFRKHHSMTTRVLLATGLMGKLFFSVLGQLLTAPMSLNARSRLRVNTTLIVWHLLGCPAGWGLSGSIASRHSAEQLK